MTKLNALSIALKNENAILLSEDMELVKGGCGRRRSYRRSSCYRPCTPPPTNMCTGGTTTGGDTTTGGGTTDEVIIDVL